MILGVNKKDNLKIQQHDNLRSQKGFTLIELMVVLSITAVLGILGIAGFTRYNQVQVLQTSVNNLTTTLNLARSRAASQVKPSTSFCIGQLDGYSVNISIENSKYTLNVVCGDVDSTNALQTTTLPKDIIFDPATNTTRVFFPVLSGKVEGAGEIIISGYEQTKEIVISEIGIFASAAIPTVAPTTPTPTLVPTSTPAPTPTSTPIPLPNKRVFATSATYESNLGGLDGANEKCRDSARAANLGGEWVAWLSTAGANGINAIARINDGRYIRMDGDLIANNKADLTDGIIARSINMDENAQVIFGGFTQSVWTGTKGNGITYDFSSCDNWTNTNAFNGIVGNITSVGSDWTNFGSIGCSARIRLYCFEQ